MAQILYTPTSKESQEYIIFLLRRFDNLVTSELHLMLEKASSTADEDNVPSLGEIMRKLRKEDPAQFQRLIKDDTRD